MPYTPAPRLPERTEWPTIALTVFLFALLAVTIVGHASIPWPLSLVALALLGGLQFSLQHEAIHGHPTRSERMNIALVGLPLSVWCPYAEYRQAHLDHHASELTVPGIDPESFHVTAQTWTTAGPVMRAALTANRTLAGRLMIGPWLTITRSLVAAARGVRTDPVARRVWAGHLALVLVTLWLVLGAAGLPVWEYVVGMVWGGLAVTNLRSFVEHRYTGGDGTPSAVVRSNAFFSLLFLNNNLHHTHHARPGAAWYRLPALHRELGSDDLARDGAGWYPGYLAVAGRYLFRPYGEPVHPREQSPVG